MARGGRGFQGTVLKALRVPEHKLTVTGVRELPPYTELIVQCPSLLGSGAAALPPTAWVRMWIPHDGREYQRAYTLTRIDRSQASARILFLHHEPAGPASQWSSHVRPGATVAVQVMGGTSYRSPSPGDRLLLVGDRASAPALVDAVNAAPVGSPATVIMLAPRDGYLPMAERDHEFIRLDPEVLEDRLLSAVDTAEEERPTSGSAGKEAASKSPAAPSSLPAAWSRTSGSTSKTPTLTSDFSFHIFIAA